MYASYGYFDNMRICGIFNIAYGHFLSFWLLDVNVYWDITTVCDRYQEGIMAWKRVLPLCEVQGVRLALKLNKETTAAQTSTVHCTTLKHEQVKDSLGMRILSHRYINLTDYSETAH